jgi:hypothetical protein
MTKYEIKRLAAILVLALTAAVTFSTSIFAQKGAQSTTGAPLKGVDVKLGKPPGGSPAARAVTNEKGNFSLPVVAAGDYMLTVELKRDEPSAVAAGRASTESTEVVKFCYITIDLADGIKVERMYDLLQNKAASINTETAGTPVAKVRFETFIVHSDGKNPINGTIVKSKSNISNN